MQWVASNQKAARIWAIGQWWCVVPGHVRWRLLWRVSVQGHAGFEPEAIQPRAIRSKAGRGKASAHPPQSPSAAHAFATDYKLLLTRSIFAVGGVSSAAGRSARPEPACPSAAARQAAGSLYR